MITNLINQLIILSIEHWFCCSEHTKKFCSTRTYDMVIVNRLNITKSLIIQNNIYIVYMVHSLSQILFVCWQK